MGETNKKSKPKWLDKLKNIKHIELYIAIIFIVILALIYMSSFTSKSDTSSGSNKTKEVTVTEYINSLEQNLENILSNISGISNVKVMITLDMSKAEVQDSKINLNTFPNINGVLITANGVDDTALKMKVLHAVQAVIEITNGKIEILSSN